MLIVCSVKNYCMILIGNLNNILLDKKAEGAFAFFLFTFSKMTGPFINIKYCRIVK